MNLLKMAIVILLLSSVSLGCKTAKFAVRHAQIPDPCPDLIWEKYEATTSFNGSVVLSGEDADTLYRNMFALRSCYKQYKIQLNEYNKSVEEQH